MATIDDGSFTFLCPRCGGSVVQGAAACPLCGEGLDWTGATEAQGRSTQRECPDCGATVPSDQEVCPECGARYAEPGERPAIEPMRLGDIFSRTFQLIGRAFTRYLPVAAILGVPMALLLTFGTHRYYSGLADILERQGKEAPTGAFSQMAELLLSIPLVVLVFLAGTIFMMVIVWSEINHRHVRWRHALARGVRRFLLPAIGQLALVLCAFGGIGVVLVIVIVVAASVPIIAVLTIPLMLVIFAYLYVRWAFALPAIVCEETGVLQSFSRSSAITRHQWWRTFGILLLMSVLTNFAITIITTPVSLIALWDFYREYFKMLGVAGRGTPEPEAFAGMLRAMGMGVGLTLSLELVLSLLVTPVYTTVLYADLRARKGDFAPPAGSAPPGTDAAAPPKMQ